MAKYDARKRRETFDRSGGRCHLCGKRIAFLNYGMVGARGAWEVDHSIPLAEGGTDRLNNLFSACISCNRSKQDRSSRSARLERGRRRAPLSIAAAERERFKQAAAGAVTGGLLGARLGGPVGFWFGAIAGGVAAYAMDPEA